MVEGGIIALTPQPPQQMQLPPQQALVPQAASQPSLPASRSIEVDLLSKMLSSRASVDPGLKALLSVVSSRGATPEQHKMFGKIVTEMKTAIERSSANQIPTQTTSAQVTGSPKSQPAIAVNAELAELAQRAPLRPLPNNPPVKPEAQQLKRKRDQPQPSAKPQVSTAG